MLQIVFLSQDRFSGNRCAEVKAVAQAILEEIDKNSELMTNVEYLCDMSGPRLTGSSGLTRVSHRARDKFKQYGLANVQLEPWIIHHAWTRGEAGGRVIEPTVQRLLLESAGWGPASSQSSEIQGMTA